MEKTIRDMYEETLAKYPELKNVPVHMWQDEIQAMELTKAGKTLCNRCGGTGNELYSMYRECRACQGNGESRGNEHLFEEKKENNL